MFRFLGSEGRFALLRTTVKAAAAIAFLSYFAANWLSSGALDRNALARLAANGAAPRNDADPATTGAIAQANGVRLDPCVGQRRP